MSDIIIEINQKVVDTQKELNDIFQLKYNKPKKNIWVTEEPLVLKKTIKYTYDSYGNWTRMDYCINSRNTYFVIREIEYYE